MKLQKYLAGALMCVLVGAAVSCSTENVENGTSKGKLAVSASSTATAVSTSSRAVLSNTYEYGVLKSITPKWEESDQIAIKVDNNATADNLTLSEGAKSASGKFKGDISYESGSKMYAYYPASAATQAVDLTSQTGTATDAAKNMVMMGTSDFSAAPTFNFTNKVTILHLYNSYLDYTDLPCGKNGDYSMYTGKVTVSGAYSKGTLGTDGNWTGLSADDITVSGATLSLTTSGGVVVHLNAYVVVLPGSKIKDLKFKVQLTNNNTGTVYNVAAPAYTSESALPANQYVTVNIPLYDVRGNSLMRYGNTSDIIGKYLYSDGKTGTTYQEGMTVGIVISDKVTYTQYTAGYTHGRAIALKNATSDLCKWSNGDGSPSPYADHTDAGHPYTITFAKCYGDVNSGYDACNSTFVTNSNNAAWCYCHNYADGTTKTFDNSGWYLPSSGDWWDVITNLADLTDTQKKYINGLQTNDNTVDYISNLSRNSYFNTLNTKFENAGGDKFITTEDDGIFVPGGPNNFWSASESQLGGSSSPRAIVLGLQQSRINFYNIYKFEAVAYARPIIAF